MADLQAELQKKINIIQQAALAQSQESEQLKQIFLNTQKSGFYNYLNSIPKIDLLKYFATFLIVFFIINEINFTNKHIIIILIGIVVIFYMNEMRKSTSITRMQELELKLNGIFPKPQFFYIDSGIIELIFSIKEYKQYNPLAFNKLISLIDNFLKLTLDVEKNTKNSYPLYDILHNLKDSALNNLHSIIYNMPSDINAEVKLTKAMDSLQFILNFHLENVRLIANKNFKTDGPKINNKYIESNIHPDGMDPYYNKNFDLY